MGEEMVPALVAIEGFQCQERFVAGQTPELTGAVEAALVLAAGGFDRSRADRFAGRAGGGIVRVRC